MLRRLLPALLATLLAGCPASDLPAPARDTGSAVGADADAAVEAPDAVSPDAAASLDAAAPEDAATLPDASRCAAPCDRSPGLCYEVLGSCDEDAGACAYPPRPSTWKCDDHDECTVGDLCDGQGGCVGGASTACVNPPRCRTAPGACVPATGKCAYPPATLGAPCDDGEPCTAGDSCDGQGACVSGPPATCTTPPDGCRQANGYCHPDQGCLYDLRPSGALCEDGDPCTLGDACDLLGECKPGLAAVCDAPPTMCFESSGGCGATGCAYPPKAKGTACTDGDPCTAGGACDGAGACVATRRTCAGTPCSPGRCDSADGQCKTTPLGAGEACELPNATAACDAAGACAPSACDPGFVASASGQGCTNFGGGFQHNASACLSCGAENPLTLACTCPAGFSEQSLRVVSDCAGAGTATGSDWRLCQLAAFSAESDYGGAFQVDDAVACGAGCRVPNPVTGDCSCPAGTQALVAEGLTDSSTCPTEVLRTQLTLCVATAAPLVAFGGAYQVDDAVAGGLGCRAPNPRTGACTCPAGTTARPRLRLLASGSGADVGSNVYLCTP
ncbi:MAG TPA: hypothetical protein VGK67_10820 [Myxococcales bacterium]|jgi:hypothetical protein